MNITLVDGKKVADVSEHQAVIDWDAVKKSGMIDAVILRVGYGGNDTSQDDKQFLRNVKECVRVGMPIMGVYLYSYAFNATMARSEADHTIRMINEGIKLGMSKDIIAYDDIEDSRIVNSCRATWPIFAANVRAAGFKVGIYTGAYYFKSYLYDATGWDTFWVAAYGNGDAILDEWARPNFGVDYDLWQYTSAQRYPGIRGGMYGVDTSIVIHGTKLNKLLNAASIPVNVATKAEETVKIDANSKLLDLVYMVMSGVLGDNENRKHALGKRYDEVQKEINYIYTAKASDLAADVLKDRFGKGEVRKTVLGSRYSEVQKAVNVLLEKRNTKAAAKKEQDAKDQLVSFGMIHSANFTFIKDTKAAVACARSFQRAINLDYQANLTLDGDFKRVSKGALGTHYVRRGETQYLVTAVKIALMLHGYDPGNMDCPGVFTATLENCVKRYQKDHALVQDGVAGPVTIINMIENW